MSTHINGYEWADAGEWLCDKCVPPSGRVAHINGTYYCESCLFNAIVVSGQLNLIGRCENCNDHIDDTTVYCSYCYDNQASEVDSKCLDCGDADAYCYDHAISNWDLTDNDHSNTDCGEGCGQEACYTYCSACLQTVWGCQECGSLEVTVRLCDEHEAQPVTAAAAQGVTVNDTGDEFVLDDGPIIAWED